jgi:hypothetical protein
MNFHIVFLCVYTCFSGDKCIYVGFLKERNIHLKKCDKSRSYNRSKVARVCRYYL